jgi:preprotein translocase subunit SecY
MTIRNTAQSIVDVIPTVRQPKKHVSFSQKIKWTVAILGLYFVMTNIPIFGLATNGGADAFGQFRSILAGGQGSILQLGIMPIVTASIVLQILTGTNVLKLDMNDPRDQNFFQGLRRALIYIMVFVNGFPIIFAGDFLPASTQVASSFGVSITAIQAIMFIQIAFGGIFLYYLDEVVTKWGVGSGLGLFIIAGVSQRFVGGLFSQVIPGWISIASGQEAISFSRDTLNMLLLGNGYIIPVITTVIIFSVIVYAESTRVEIPVSNTRVGNKGNYKIKLIYASVLPIILVRAVQANVQFLGQGISGYLGSNMPAWLGQYSADGQVFGGLFYYLTPIFTPEDWMWWLGFTSAEPLQIALRILVDLGFMVVGGALFAVFWVKTTNRDAEAVAQQLHASNMAIPGFRRDSNQMSKVLDRYIPYVTIVGGALIGLLAVTTNMMGTIGAVNGTGLLLAVSITYQIYEEIAEEIATSALSGKIGLD